MRKQYYLMVKKSLRRRINHNKKIVQIRKSKKYKVETKINLIKLTKFQIIRLNKQYREDK